MTNTNIDIHEIARVAVESFNGVSDLSLNYANRLLFKAMRNYPELDLQPEKREQLKSDLESTVYSELKSFTPSTKPSSTIQPTETPEITKDEINRLVGEVFHTTITGEAEQLKYLSQKAEHEIKVLVEDRGLDEKDQGLVMNSFYNILRQHISDVEASPIFMMNQK